ncbi:MAG: sulfurtransferase TusA family protein [bacterium]
MEADCKLDAFGLLCPMPVIRTAEKMKAMKPGEVLEVTANDPGIKEDMPAWCKSTGNEFLGIEESGGEYKVYVKKTA